MCGRTETVERRRMVRALAGAAAVLLIVLPLLEAVAGLLLGYFAWE